ncbi:hypothetical protein GCM10010915_11890 [Microbacterium faecale]|uniref:Uncharacterized protein n=1 Tax=Microbacterium faecale TaxID=1804630 RepID=A0A917DFD4_9MICO|nr:hypothetical protein [Microbacterium faecale]GGD33123.1 hypothetical protein GCM10010915_11890 [Microbacterium faecale]
MNDTEGSEWESKIPASAVYVTQDGESRRLSEVLADLDGGDVTVAWGDISGVPASFTPADHTHATSDVEGLDAELAGKAATGHTHTVAQVADLQGIINDFETRIAALEAPA